MISFDDLDVGEYTLSLFMNLMATLSNEFEGPKTSDLLLLELGTKSIYRFVDLFLKGFRSDL